MSRRRGRAQSPAGAESGGRSSPYSMGSLEFSADDGFDYLQYPILLVDDEIENIQAFDLNFRDKFTIDTALSGPEALAKLREREFAVLISDQRMPGMTGVQLLEKTVDRHPYLIRIILTGYTDQESLIGAVNQGRIYAYITKPWRPEEIEITLRRGIERFALDAHNRRLIADLKKERAALKRKQEELEETVEEQTQKLRHANERLHKLAISDGLTGLYNHRYFQDRWRREVQLARRYDEPLSLMILDVDFFKNYNDTMGHPQGDVLLKELSMLLLRSVREVDLVARYGGEEFVIVLPKSRKTDAVVLAERVRALVGQHSFPHRDVQPGGRVTVSMGVASFPEDGADAGEVIVNADKALYRAKRGGRDQVVAAAGMDPRRASNLSDDEQDMDLVVEEDGLTREAATAATDLPQASIIDTLRFRAMNFDDDEQDESNVTIEHPGAGPGREDIESYDDIRIEVVEDDDD